VIDSSAELADRDEVQRAFRRLSIEHRTIAPADVPDRLIHATRERVAVTRHRGWTDPFEWRHPSALRTPVAATGLLAVVVVAAMLALSNRSGSIGTQPTPSVTASVSTSTSPSPSVAASPSACAGPGETCLSSGTYTSTGFVPSVTYKVRAGWVLMTDVRRELDLRYGAGGHYTYPDGLSFHDAISIFRRPVAESATSKVALACIGTKANDLVQWLAHHPDLVASAPTRAVVGGIPPAASIRSTGRARLRCFHRVSEAATDSSRRDPSVRDGRHIRGSPDAGQRRQH
jgi:hypothetical protein